MKGYFIIDNVKYNILHAFKKKNDCYVIYTDNNDVLASKYEIVNNQIKLLPIEDYSLVEKEWDNYNE